MTTLTIQVDDALLKKTQAIAKAKEASLDEYVVDLLQRAALQDQPVERTNGAEERGLRWDAMMAKFGRFDTGAPFSKEELNER